MIELPKVFEDLQTLFNKFPGIGQKSAMKMALNLKNFRPEFRQELIEALRSLDELETCELCGLYSEKSTCLICASEERVDSGQICVVENISDLLAVESSEKFKGTYFVLGGVLNPLLGIGPNELKIDKLIKIVKNREVHEIILAVGPTLEGDATCTYLKDIFTDASEVTRIGFGIPMGGNLEYLDSLTIGKALENKQGF